MSGDLVIQLGQEALMVVMLVSAPMLGLGLLGWAAPAAARYQDPTLRFSLELPPGWTARARPPGAPADNTVRLRPPRRTDRDRGQVRVDVWPGPVLKPAALARHLADIGSDDDAAVLARRPASARQPGMRMLRNAPSCAIVGRCAGCPLPTSVRSCT